MRPANLSMSRTKSVTKKEQQARPRPQFRLALSGSPLGWSLLWFIVVALFLAIPPGAIATAMRSTAALPQAHTDRDEPRDKQEVDCYLLLTVGMGPTEPATTVTFRFPFSL